MTAVAVKWLTDGTSAGLKRLIIVTRSASVGNLGCSQFKYIEIAFMKAHKKLLKSAVL